MQIINCLGIHVELPVWFILLSVATVLYFVYMTWNNDIFQRLGCPYLKPLPLVGTMPYLMKKGILAHDQMVQQKYGRVAGAFFCWIPEIIISDPALLKQILVKEFNNFTNRLDIFAVEDVAAAMMTQAKDEKWKNIRTTLTPTFSGGKLKQMTKQINVCADQMLKHMANDPTCKTGFDFKTFGGSFTMDSIARVGFGIQLDSHGDADNDFVTNAKPFFTFSFANLSTLVMFFFPFLFKPLQSMGKMSTLPKKETEFFLGIVKQAIQQRDKREEKLQSDLLQLMMDAHNLPEEEDDDNVLGAKQQGSHKKKLTENEVLAQALLVFIAGYETTANTISFAAYNLATNPECQEKAIQEVDDIIGDKVDVTYEDLKKLKYLQQIIDETLRLYPQIGRLDRVAKSTITLNDVTIPKDMQVVVPVMAMHYDPEFYPNPEKFDPDRFSDDGKAKRDPFTYFPFGMGPRSCIGMRLALTEIKMALMKILQKYKFARCPKTPVPMKLKVVQTVPEDGWWLKVEER